MVNPDISHSIAKVPRKAKVATELVTIVKKVDTFLATVLKKRSLTTKVKVVTKVTTIPEEHQRVMVVNKVVTELATIVRKVDTFHVIVLKRENHVKKVVTKVTVVTEMKADQMIEEAILVEDTKVVNKVVTEPVTIVKRADTFHVIVLKRENHATMTEVKAVTKVMVVIAMMDIRRTILMVVKAKRKVVLNVGNKDTFPKNVPRKFNALNANKRVTSLMSARVTKF